MGEENPRTLFVLLAILVFLLHVWFWMWLGRSEPPVTPAKPMIMEVTMLAIPKPVSEAPTTPQPVKKVVPPKKPKPVIKPKRKRLPKKKPAVVKKTPETPKYDPLAELKASAEPVSAPAPPPVPATAKAGKVSKAPVFTEANFRANYGFNPKPEYPRIARKRGWEGKVLLKVSVSAEGYSTAVAVHRGSGHSMLDESAVAAVKKWKFIPAKRGDTSVASTVIVPINFKLN